MNIFILDENIDLCANYHCDQHVVKMILESTQILCSALHLHGIEAPYKPTHTKHPCVLWAKESLSNFRWLSKLAYSLNDEFRYRFEHHEDHKSIAVIDEVQQYLIPDKGLTDFPQVMPEQYKVPGNAVLAYRKFYIYDKSRFATWTKREQPQWYKEGLRKAKI